MHTERNAVCNLTPLEYVCGVAFSLVRLSLCLCCLPVHEGSETEACPSSRRNRRRFTDGTASLSKCGTDDLFRSCSGHLCLEMIDRSVVNNVMGSDFWHS